MTRFSANLGFLWADIPLPDAIHQAAAAGFDAVECHWPYAFDTDVVRGALTDTGLPMLGLNTRRGAQGDNGLSAVPGREVEARAAIDEALDYARAVKATAVHVMAGFAQGPAAHACFIENLRYASACASDDVTVLIEPLNHHDAPGYFLNTSAQAAQIIAQLGLSNVKLMFDCYHLQIMEGDLTRRLTDLLPIIGHIQIASVPDRGAPDHGEVSYLHIYQHLKDLGYDQPLGAEYKPNGDTGAELKWMVQACQL